MIKQLHPTLKKCKCGLIGNKNTFYNHMDQMAEVIADAKEFWAQHGEVPLNTSDPSITCPQCHMTSYNINDIEKRYCDNCHQFHDDMGIPV